MDTRKAQEAEFHNELRRVQEDSHVADTRWTPEMEDTIRSNPFWANMKYYAVERKSRDFVLQWFSRHCRGKQVLDYCCGNGEDGRVIAQYGAQSVVGIDISEVSIENCISHAKEMGIGVPMSYSVRDAEDTGFPDNSFDVITEYGALHHLDRDKAFPEMARILRPDGKVICTEALGHNLLIHLYRKATPHLRTQWEVAHIMRRPDFEAAHQSFQHVELHFFHLLTLMAVPFRKTRYFPRILAILEKIDSGVLKVPGIQWWAWQAVFIMSGPRKETHA